MADDRAADGRRSGATRTVVLAVASWVAVVVVASAVAWLAIGRAGSEVLDPAAQRLPTTTGTAATTAPPTTAATTPPPTTPAPTTPAAPPPGTTTTPPATGAPAVQPVDKFVTVTGGQAGFRCTGAALTLGFAQPATGWSVSSSASDGGARLRVEFEADGARTRLEATCVDGGPSVSVESDDGGGGGGGGDDD